MLLLKWYYHCFNLLKFVFIFSPLLLCHFMQLEFYARPRTRRRRRSKRSTKKRYALMRQQMNEIKTVLKFLSFRPQEYSRHTHNHELKISLVLYFKYELKFSSSFCHVLHFLIAWSLQNLSLSLFFVFSLMQQQKAIWSSAVAGLQLMKIAAGAHSSDGMRNCWIINDCWA